MHVIDRSNLITARELAHAKRVTVMTISRWIHRGCPVVRTRPYLFNLEEVEAWLFGTNQPMEEPEKR